MSINSTLLIGLGTTGLDILEAVARRLDERLGSSPDGQTSMISCVQMLALVREDTPKAYSNYIRRVTIQTVPATVEEYMTRPDVSPTVPPIFLSAGDNRELITEMYRLYPHIELLVNEENIRNEISTMRTRLTNRDMPGGQSNVCNPSSDSVTTAYYLVGSLGEIITSGIFLDLAFIIQSIARDGLDEHQITPITGILLLPDEDDLPEDEHDQREQQQLMNYLRATSQAALRELDFFLTNPGSYTLRAPGPHTPRHRVHPFNSGRLYIVERVNQRQINLRASAMPHANALPPIINMIGEWLYRHMADDVRAVDPDEPSSSIRNRYGHYSGFGISVLSIPVANLRDYLTSRFIKQFTEEYLLKRNLAAVDDATELKNLMARLKLESNLDLEREFGIILKSSGLAWDQIESQESQFMAGPLRLKGDDRRRFSSATEKFEYRLVMHYTELRGERWTRMEQEVLFKQRELEKDLRVGLQREMEELLRSPNNDFRRIDGLLTAYQLFSRLVSDLEQRRLPEANQKLKDKLQRLGRRDKDIERARNRLHQAVQVSSFFGPTSPLTVVFLALAGFAAFAALFVTFQVLQDPNGTLYLNGLIYLLVALAFLVGWPIQLMNTTQSRRLDLIHRYTARFETQKDVFLCQRQVSFLEEVARQARNILDQLSYLRDKMDDVNTTIEGQYNALQTNRDMVLLNKSQEKLDVSILTAEDVEAQYRILWERRYAILDALGPEVLLRWLNPDMTPERIIKAVKLEGNRQLAAIFEQLNIGTFLRQYSESELRAMFAQRVRYAAPFWTLGQVSPATTGRAPLKTGLFINNHESYRDFEDLLAPMDWNNLLELSDCYQAIFAASQSNIPLWALPTIRTTGAESYRVLAPSFRGPLHVTRNAIATPSVVPPDNEPVMIACPLTGIPITERLAVALARKFMKIKLGKNRNDMIVSSNGLAYNFKYADPIMRKMDYGESDVSLGLTPEDCVAELYEHPEYYTDLAQQVRDEIAQETYYLDDPTHLARDIQEYLDDKTKVGSPSDEDGAENIEATYVSDFADWEYQELINYRDVLVEKKDNNNTAGSAPMTSRPLI